MTLLCIGARKRANVIEDLIRLTNPELMVAVFPELHTAGHQWLNKETPGHRRHDPALVETLGSPTRAVYDAVDRAVGQVIDRLPSDTTVLLACLGGIRVTHGGGYLLTDLLDRLGYAVLPGRDDQRKGGSNVEVESPPGLYFDWSRTRAFALPWAYDGYLRINQRGREPGGIVVAGAERDALLGEIEQAVRELRVARTGEPAAMTVVRAQEAFPGAACGELPDLMVLWNNAQPIDAVVSARAGRIENRDPAGRSKHAPEGGLFACGPLIADGPTLAGARDYDLAPTVLSLLGVEPPRELGGRALSALVAQGASPPTVPAAERAGAGVLEPKVRDAVARVAG